MMAPSEKATTIMSIDTTTNPQNLCVVIIGRRTEIFVRNGLASNTRKVHDANAINNEYITANLGPGSALK